MLKDRWWRTKKRFLDPKLPMRKKKQCEKTTQWPTVGISYRKRRTTQKVKPRFQKKELKAMENHSQGVEINF